MPVTNPLLMKTLRNPAATLISLMLLVITPDAFSQLSNGGVHAYFGVDADTRNAYVKYGPSTGNIASDDWFGPMSGNTRGVIDTSNAAYYKSQLQANRNITFSKGMAVPMYTKVNNTLWLDGIYARDHVSQRNILGTVTARDSSSFSGGSKNGDNPSTWAGATASVDDKIDFIDVYAHMRRNGLTVTDSLWFFSSVSTAGTSGSR